VGVKLNIVCSNDLHEEVERVRFEPRMTCRHLQKLKALSASYLDSFLLSFLSYESLQRACFQLWLVQMHIMFHCFIVLLHNVCMLRWRFSFWHYIGSFRWAFLFSSFFFMRRMMYFRFFSQEFTVLWSTSNELDSKCTCLHISNTRVRVQFGMNRSQILQSMYMQWIFTS